MISPLLYLGGAEKPPRGTVQDHGAGITSAELAGKRVLIVEDEAVTQMQLRLICRRAGMVIAGSATTGEEAVAMALQENPDLILMDIHLRGELDGLEAMKQIVGRSHVCIVVLTAYSEHLESARAIGAAGYIVKPIVEGRLVPALINALEDFGRRPA
ncbi:MAG TPA: response regulator [Chthonomonadales bacterium]|nr:response regulator [Chthonomonadales bacterium]